MQPFSDKTEKTTGQKDIKTDIKEFRLKHVSLPGSLPRYDRASAAFLSTRPKLCHSAKSRACIPRTAAIKERPGYESVHFLGLVFFSCACITPPEFLNSLSSLLCLSRSHFLSLSLVRSLSLSLVVTRSSPREARPGNKTSAVHTCMHGRTKKGTVERSKSPGP